MSHFTSVRVIPVDEAMRIVAKHRRKDGTDAAILVNDVLVDVVMDLETWAIEREADHG